MKVKLITGVLYPTGSRTPAGTVIEVSDDKGADWIKRGIAEKTIAPPAASPPKPVAPPEKRK